MQDTSEATATTVALKRSLSVTAVTFYGVGAILGAGIYVLIGEVAGLAGYHAPLAFLLAAVIATFSACSYAELSSRFPRSAGEAVYIEQAFHRQWLTQLVGWLVIATGIVSAATMATGVVGYVHTFVDLPPALVIIVFMAFIGTVALWGINQSALVVALITLLEAGGLCYVIVVAGDRIAEFPFARLLSADFDHHFPISGLLLASFLALYAFIGFEDIVNIAEEVKQPGVTLPRAILASLLIATFFYISVTVAALAVLSPEQLAASSAPLAAVVSQQGHSVTWISLVSLLAVVNGAIVQLIMASRVLYGMAKSGWLPKPLAAVNPRTRTPILATLFSIAVTLLLALLFPLATLAQATSLIILCVFALVNAALLWLKRHPQWQSEISYPKLVPILGFGLCSAAMGIKLWYWIA